MQWRQVLRPAGWWPRRVLALVLLLGLIGLHGADCATGGAHRPVSAHAAHSPVMHSVISADGSAAPHAVPAGPVAPQKHLGHSTAWLLVFGLLLALVLASARPGPAATPARASRSPGPPPFPWGRLTLAQVCVLRI
ncbi:hypothetical protein [Longispora albida]|uniref:hypothetical protein n=1 Tax=Longispora albida TaxID=203523 RepID=UPI0003663568|nr:hypothetical protein [Longispora albida]